MFFEPMNNGTIWDGKDLRLLNSCIESGMHIDKIASRLGRTPSACLARINIIRTAKLYYSGNDHETLRDFKMEINK